MVEIKCEKPGGTKMYEKQKSIPQNGINEKVEDKINLPENKFRAGAITATIWKNSLNKDGTEASFNSITLERSYKDKSGNWQTTSSFRINDLPRLTLLLNKAYEYITCKQDA
jgi:hypothetical protein